MDSIDSNIWGILAMPVGLLICFGPILIAWVISESRNRSGQNPKDNP